MSSRIAGQLALILGVGALIATPAQAHPRRHERDSRRSLTPGNLLVSESTYAPAPIYAGITPLPPECPVPTANAPAPCKLAIADGYHAFDFPGVFNNSSVDPFFGITSPVSLLELTPSGRPVATIRVPDEKFVTSFSSKSELALNLSPEGKYVSFVGYDASPGMVDVSNANTPGVIDPGNGDLGPYFRVVAQLDRQGHFTFTRTNAYSGDNGRAAITNDENGNDLIYSAGNAGQSKHPTNGVILGAGAQFITPSSMPEADQTPGQPTPLGSFNITELGYQADKATKDNNYRGIAINRNVVYYTKGSGGNGINTVYFVDTTGKACPNGVGLPAANAQLPTSPPPFSVSSAGGPVPTNMCILKGFPTTLASSPTASNYPFGLWFANDHTLYVADEGVAPGTITYSSSDGGIYPGTTATDQPQAGLEKWVFDSSSQSWKEAYVLQTGLNLGHAYQVPGYPTGDNPATGLPWAPATQGLRALTGRVNKNGTVDIWATTSTVSGSGDTGADPDKLVAITDRLGATGPTAPPWESFTTVRSARAGQVLRGVSFTPGTSSDSDR